MGGISLMAFMTLQETPLTPSTKMKSHLLSPRVQGEGNSGCRRHSLSNGREAQGKQRR